ncbi:hypothetical protein PV963_41680 [Streptomyces coeruleorubidus]|nr:hypothetical protein [Streptomyces coeruleorubidus]WDV56390.1 hypothetical protein PV963_41680 [Streptomyces coeruleorubidus]
MISTRRVVAAVGLAAGVTGLAAPMAHAADAESRSPLSPVATLDSLTVSDIPAEHEDEIPRPSSQPTGLNRRLSPPRPGTGSPPAPRRAGRR